MKSMQPILCMTLFAFAAEADVTGLYRDGELVEAIKTESTYIAPAPGAPLTEPVFKEFAAAQAEVDRFLDEADTVGLRAAWDRFTASSLDVLKAMADIETFLRSQKASSEILARHTSWFNEVNEGITLYTTVVEAALQGADPGDLGILPVGTTESLLPDEPVPDSARVPLKNKSSGRTRTATTLTLSSLPPPTDVPGADHLAATPDIPLNAEITNQANALGRSPQAIYEFVRNEIAWETYYGSRKGALMTLQQRAGNDLDQASLLIALLRASGIPSRYAQGVGEIQPASRLASWVGVEGGDEAAGLLLTAGFQAVQQIAFDGTTSSVHVALSWVEAYLPYGNYRGVPLDASGRTWVPLCPAVKPQTISHGMNFVTSMNFNADAFLMDYISNVYTAMPMERFESQVQGWLNTNHPGTLVDEVVWRHDTEKEYIGLLPASPPFEIIAVSNRTATLTDADRVRVRIHVYRGTTNFVDQTLPLSALAAGPVHINFIAATTNDQATVDSFGGIYTTPPQLVQLKALLQVNGANISTSTVTIGPGRRLDCDIHFLEPPAVDNDVPVVGSAFFSGADRSIVFNTYADRYATAPLPFNIDTAGPLLTEHLDSVARDYLSRITETHRRSEDLFGMSLVYNAFPIIVGNDVNVTTSLGNPTTFSWVGMELDVNARFHASAPMDGLFNRIKAHEIVTGMQGSMHESRVFEENYDVGGVSTLKILSLAEASGMPICVISNSVPAQCPGFSHSAGVLALITNAIASGKQVIVHRDPFTISNWTGVGYTKLTPDGDGGYTIARNGGALLNGGATAETWPANISCDIVQYSSTVLVPNQDTPALAGTFPADDTPMEFDIQETVTCDESIPVTFVRHLATSRTKKQLGGGVYELRQGANLLRRVAILGGNLTVDSNNDRRVLDDDDVVEDGKAMIFWVNDDNNGSTDPNQHKAYFPPDAIPLPQAQWNCNDTVINGIFDLVDLAPLRIRLDAGTFAALNSLGYKIGPKSSGIRYHWANKKTTQGGVMGTGSYWFNMASAQEQVSLGQFGIDGVTLTQSYIPITFYDPEFTAWFAFEGLAESDPGGQVIELAAFTPAGVEAFVLDKVRVDLRHSYSFFETRNARGAQTSVAYLTERLENGGGIRTNFTDQYTPSPPTEGDGTRFQNAQNVLVLLHGYNVSIEDSNMTYQNWFKRLYLSGYRGDMVAFKWHGNENVSVPPFFGFDENVENAFQSSISLMNVIQSLYLQGKTVNIAAHSLGNLPLVDALRRYKLTQPGTQFIRNIIHVEAAIWSRVYDERPAPSGTNYITREVEQKATWSHWAADVPGAIYGRIVNSYNPNDAALYLQLLNDDADGTRSRWDPLALIGYETWALAEAFRTPERLAYEIPRYQTVAYPHIYTLGSVKFHRPDVANVVNYNNRADFGWNNTAHSDFRERYFQEVWPWWRTVMLNNIQ